MIRKENTNTSQKQERTGNHGSGIYRANAQYDFVLKQTHNMVYEDKLNMEEVNTVG